jgi:hypothetical protein
MIFVFEPLAAIPALYGLGPYLLFTKRANLKFPRLRHGRILLLRSSVGKGNGDAARFRVLARQRHPQIANTSFPAQSTVGETEYRGD